MRMTALGVGLWLGGLTGCSAIIGISDLPLGDGGATDGGEGTSSGSSGVGGSSGGKGSSGASGSGSSGASGSGSSGASGSGSSSGASCTIPAGAVCSVAPQCGCPTGEKCDIGGSAAAGCIAAGAGAEGDLCGSNTDCGPTLTCGGGVCHAYCASDNAACNSNECVQIGSASQSQDTVCTIDCTLTPDSCGSGATCIPYEANGTVTGDCEVQGTGGYGATCTSNLDCEGGLGCTAPAGSGGETFCIPWCELSPRPSACSTGTCAGFATPVIINGITYGYCNP